MKVDKATVDNALYEIERQSYRERPTLESAIAYWYEQEQQIRVRYRQERYQKEMCQRALLNKDGEIASLKARLMPPVKPRYGVMLLLIVLAFGLGLILRGWL